MENEARARKGVVVGRERERLTLETLGMRKWRGIKVEVDCDAQEEEKVTQIQNLSL